MELSIAQAPAYKNVWKRLKQIKFHANIDWLSESDKGTAKHRQVAYDGEKVRNWGPRFDAVEYVQNEPVRKGFLQLLLEGKIFGAKTRVALIRRLRQVDAHSDNVTVVQTFGHLRYGYDMREQPETDVIIDFVLATDFRLVLHIVRDFHDTSMRFSISKRPNEILDHVKNEKQLDYSTLEEFKRQLFPEIHCRLPTFPSTPKFSTVAVYSTKCEFYESSCTTQGLGKLQLLQCGL